MDEPRLWLTLIQNATASQDIRFARGFNWLEYEVSPRGWILRTRIIMECYLINTTDPLTDIFEAVDLRKTAILSKSCLIASGQHGEIVVP
jgi:hypothetical protein